MLPGLKVDVVLKRGNDLEADTGADVGADDTEDIVLRFAIVVEVGPGLGNLELWYDGVDADSRGTDPVAKELDTGVEELRRGNGVNEEDVVLDRLEELRLPPTASADVVVVALSFKLGKTLQDEAVLGSVVERGGFVTTGALEFVAWTLL